MRLRPYELRAVRELPALLKAHRRVVTVSPTGSGKTVIASAIIRKMRGKRVLWLAHRIELLKQACEQLLAAGLLLRDLSLLAGVGTVTLKGGEVVGVNPAASVTVASVDMFRSREVPRCDLIVVDEAHRVMAASYRKILDARPRAQVLGLTATPWRLDGEPLGDVFEHLHLVAESVELIADGYIAGPIVYGVPEDKARKIVKGLTSVRGDYNGREVERAAMRYLLGDVVSERKRLAPGARTLVFAATRKHGKALARRFKRAGVAAEYLDGETGTIEREAMIERLRTGESEVLVNVDVLSEGFDCPPVKCIALARPTRSLTRFLQQVGRGSRRWGNQRPVILDHAGNCWRFGLPTTPREWSLDGVGTGKKTGEVPVHVCADCESLVPIGCAECPECGARLPMTRRQKIERDAELERMCAKADEKSRVASVLKEISSSRPNGWLSRAIRELGLSNVA